MTTGLSIWWTTPTGADAHFTAEELARSSAHHRPLRRAALVGLAVKIALLAGAGLAAEVIGDWFGIEWSVGDRPGWIGVASSGPVVLGAGLTVLALRLPAVAVDGWFEYRFRRGIEGYRPLPPGPFVATAVALVVGTWMVLSVLAGLGYRLAVANRAWPAVLAVAVGFSLAIAAIGERWFRRVVSSRERPIEQDSPAGPQFEALVAELNAAASAAGGGPIALAVERHGVVGVAEGHGVVGVAEGHGPGWRSEARLPQAWAAGLGRSKRVVLTDALLSADRATQHFVVAHETTHLARGHVAVRTAVVAASYGMAIAALAVLADSGRPWAWFGLSPYDPRGLPVLVLALWAVVVVIGPLAAWISRAQERSADRGAIAAVGPLDSGAARKLQLGSGVELDPPWWTRLFAGHPAPAERLEYLARHRRAGSATRAHWKTA